MTLAVQPTPVFRRTMKANVAGPAIVALTSRQAELRDLYMERFRSAFISRGRVAFPRFALDLTTEDQTIRDKYREMLRDPYIKAAIFAKVLSVASQDLTLTPADPDNPASVLQAEMLTYALTHVEGGLVALAWSVLIGALLDGKALCEYTLGPIEKGKWRGKVKLARLKDKDPRTYDLVCDDFLNVRLIRPKNLAYQPQRYFDPKSDGFVLYQHAKIYANPHGMSDLRAAYRGYDKLQLISHMRMIGLDKFTGPFLVGKTSDDRQAALADSIRQARADGYLVMDTTTEVQVLDLMARGTVDFELAEGDAIKEIYTAIRGAYLQQTEGKTPDGRGNTEVHKDEAELFEWHLSAAVESILNEQLLPPLTEVNFGPEAEPPSAHLGAISVAYNLQQLQVDEGLGRMGLKLSAKEAYARYQRSPPKDEADTLRPAPVVGKPPAPGTSGFAADPSPQQPAEVPAAPFRRLTRSERWDAYAGRR